MPIDFGEPWIPLEVISSRHNDAEARHEFTVRIAVHDNIIKARPSLVTTLKTKDAPPRITRCVNLLAGVDLDHLSTAQMLAIEVLRGNKQAIPPLVDICLETLML